MMRVLLFLLTFGFIVPLFKGDVCFLILPAFIFDMTAFGVLLQFPPLREVGGWYGLTMWLMVWAFRFLIVLVRFQSSRYSRAAMLLAYPLLYVALVAPQVRYLPWHFYVLNIAFFMYVMVAILKIRKPDY